MCVIPETAILEPYETSTASTFAGLTNAKEPKSTVDVAEL
jgi:hypothetical protein